MTGNDGKAPAGARRRSLFVRGLFASIGLASTLPPLPLSTGVVPKNRFYLGAILLTPQVRAVLEASHPGSRAMLDEVAARAYAGANYYKWGNPSVYGTPAVRAFANEFEFHRQMRDATKNLPDPEVKANARRAEEFEGRFTDGMASAYCHGYSAPQNCTELPILRQKGVLESLGGDPWIRTHVLANRAFAAHVRTNATSADVDGALATAILLHADTDKDSVRSVLEPLLARAPQDGEEAARLEAALAELSA